MRTFFLLLGHEIRMLLLLPTSYVAAGLFLALMSFLYTLSIFAGATELGDRPPVSLFFQLFFLPVCFMVPLLTMRLLAEERRLGTLQSVLSTGVSPLQVVSAKFLAAYGFYLGMWLLTLGFPWLLEQRMPVLVAEARLWDRGALVGGLGFIAVTGLLYVSLGLFCSALTRSQLVAGMGSFCGLFALTLGPALIDPEMLTSAPVFRWLTEPLAFLRAFDQLTEVSRGVLDTRPLVLYLSAAAALLGATTLSVEAQRGSPT